MKTPLLFIAGLIGTSLFAQNLDISEFGRYTDGREGACEITAYDKTSKRLFTTNAASDSIDIVDVADFANPVYFGGINVLSYGGGVNSVVNLNNGYFAAAIEAETKQDNGKVVIFTVDGTFVKEVTVGALPDMITVTKDGSKIITANEGEPNADYTVDPEGSISIIDISGGVQNISQSDVTTLSLSSAPATIDGGVFKPGTTKAVDLEPEYIAVNETSTMATVICQENNVFVFVDLTNNTISGYKGLGFKNHNEVGNGLDVSNKDNMINIQNWDIKGVFQPDAIASVTIGGNDFVLSANEGDGRDYDGYSSETRIKDLVLDSIAFPNAENLQADSVLGRLKTFTADMMGDTDADGDVDELYSYGARSFSIWNAEGELVWDSGDQFEQYIADNHENFFNCNSGKASKSDSRSDDKGPEPESVTVGKIGERFYAFVGLERQGGIMIYDITNPNAPVFDSYVHSMDESTEIMTDIAPEGILFLTKEENHSDYDVLISSHEISGTTTIFKIEDNTVGFNENDVENFSCFPNPMTNIINIKGDLSQESTYQLTDMLGRKIKSGILNSNTIPVSELENGMYVLSIYQSNVLIYSTELVK
ncbi:MAG: choice-of-anchor I family protein [Flavobacteriales bacterium]